MDIANEIAGILLQIKAIKLSPQKPFTWASGMRSPIYCDNRSILSHPGSRDRVVEALVRQSASFASFNAIAGVATAGIPHGILLADRLKLPFVYVRDKPKSHGRQNLIEGELEAGASVLVVEDLISTGGSSLKAVGALREAGAKISGVLAIFNYGFPESARAFQEAACPLATLSNYDALLKKAVEMGYISNAENILLADWKHDPREWGERFTSGSDTIK
jgi:orotate phosphoribosyltransferase